MVFKIILMIEGNFYKRGIIFLIFLIYLRMIPSIIPTLQIKPEESNKLF